MNIYPAHFFSLSLLISKCVRSFIRSGHGQKCMVYFIYFLANTYGGGADVGGCVSVRRLNRENTEEGKW